MTCTRDALLRAALGIAAVFGLSACEPTSAPVPPLEPADDTERRRFKAAETRKALRKELAARFAKTHGD